jgi:hypothetical protein
MRWNLEHAHMIHSGKLEKLTAKEVGLGGCGTMIHSEKRYRVA